LNTAKFIREGDNAILIGPPGTGKSHVAKAIACSALREGWRVIYAEADALLGELIQAPAIEKRKRLKPVIDADLVVLDDLFLARKTAHETADELQSLLHKRYQRRASTLITSNRIISDWEKCLGDAALTTAILDRLMHRSVLVEFHGRSYRLKEAACRLGKHGGSE
jgi:DNA replication protein DnaC